MADAAARSEELSLEEHRRLLDELAEAGCLWILYTGGEIFARADFLEIYGAEVHACGLVEPGNRGLLFVGASGAGKSTTCRGLLPPTGAGAPHVTPCAYPGSGARRRLQLPAVLECRPGG
jgi:hypothetical protein